MKWMRPYTRELAFQLYEEAIAKAKETLENRLFEVEHPKRLRESRASSDAHKERHERWEKVLAFREAGMTYGAIGTKLRVSTDRAMQIYRKAKRINDNDGRCRDCLPTQASRDD